MSARLAELHRTLAALLQEQARLQEQIGLSLVLAGSRARRVLQPVQIRERLFLLEEDVHDVSIGDAAHAVCEDGDVFVAAFYFAAH